MDESFVTDDDEYVRVFFLIAVNSTATRLIWWCPSGPFGD